MQRFQQFVLLKLLRLQKHSNLAMHSTVKIICQKSFVLKQWCSNWGSRSPWSPRSSFKGPQTGRGFLINHPVDLCLIRRRRRLAGHLFQDRWKDRGRGFVLLPPWPPNCLGQMLTVRDFSQHLVSSSKTIRPNIPRGARCMGHCEMM